MTSIKIPIKKGRLGNLKSITPLKIDKPIRTRLILENNLTFSLENKDYPLDQHKEMGFLHSLNFLKVGD